MSLFPCYSSLCIEAGEGVALVKTGKGMERSLLLDATGSLLPGLAPISCLNTAHNTHTLPGYHPAPVPKLPPRYCPFPRLSRPLPRPPPRTVLMFPCSIPSVCELARIVGMAAKDEPGSSALLPSSLAGQRDPLAAVRQGRASRRVQGLNCRRKNSVEARRTY